MIENLANSRLRRVDKPPPVIQKDGLHPALSSWNRMREIYGTNIPKDVLENSERKIVKAIEDYNSPNLEDRDAVFLIHSRRAKGKDPYLDDAGKCFKALDRKYGIPDEAVEEFWNLMPPFEVGVIGGTLQDGTSIKVSVMSVPITPQGLEGTKGASERVNYARPMIEDAVRLTKRMGANVVGLGETLASLTNHARVLSDKFPDMEFATGHSFTTYFIKEWVEEAARIKNVNLQDSSVTIIGADGSIGSSTTDLLLEKGVGQIVLHDKPERKGKLNKKALEIIQRFPHLAEKVIVTGGDEELEEACKNSQIIVCASSNTEPFIKAEHLNPGTIIINDSQPPAIDFEEAAKANSMVLEVLGKLPAGLTNTFDYGLVGGAEWSCAHEVLAKFVAGKSMKTTGPVTTEMVKIAADWANKLGLGELPVPQSTGRPYIIASA